MIWQPANLTEICPVNSHLTACTSFGYIYFNLLVQLYGGSFDKRVQAKLGYEGREDSDKEVYDFIVVGAGSAGCALANRLTELEGWKVLLLEAGPEQPDITMPPGLSTPLEGSSVDWGYTTEPTGRSCLARLRGRCAWPRGKMMGGSSSINTMVYVRGNKLDYDSWAEMGNDGWSYRDVLPYFKKLENNLNIEALNTEYFGTHGPQAISRYPYIDKPSILLTEAFNQIGLPLRNFNGPEQEGTNQAQAFAKDGLRVSTNNGYIQPIRYKRKNLTVKVESEATKILIDDKKRAYGVEYARSGKTYTALARKEVIVSCGTVNSPKLLLLSGIGPKKHLDDVHIPIVEELPVGENLHDHVSFTGLIIAFSNETSTYIPQAEQLQQLIEFKEAKVKNGPLSSSGPFNAVSFFKTDKNLPAPDIQIQTASIIWREYLNDPVNFENVEIGVLPSVYYDGVIPRVQNMVPKSRGRLILNATNLNGPPLLYPNYLYDVADIETIKRGVQRILALEHTKAFKEGGARFIKVALPACTNYVWGTDEYVECMTRMYTFALSHQVGTCKMAPRYDPTGVVDPRLKVKGVDGLRVIDASIMPVVIRGNTNAPAIMIGEKGADMVKEDWGRKDGWGYKED